MLRKLTPRLLLVICALLWGKSAIAVTFDISQIKQYSCDRINAFDKVPGYSWDFVNDDRNQYICFYVAVTATFGDQASFDAFVENRSNVDYRVWYSYSEANADDEVVDIIYQVINPDGWPAGMKNYATNPEEADKYYGWRLSPDYKLSTFMRVNLVQNNPIYNGNIRLGYEYGTVNECQDIYGNPIKICTKIGYIVIRTRPTETNYKYKQPGLNLIFYEPEEFSDFLYMGGYCAGEDHVRCNNTMSSVSSNNATLHVLPNEEVGKPIDKLQQVLYLSPL